ncbi:hypothetical protein FDP41_000031 [Naegleria fowleri]|uniref:Alcohol dehydrogenase-like N-terminal domain-containing protein n=1 Tax=Naegleria fowleri TaxID=5763 RepID=A0A6A5CD26_NAEFO|nr:uncharacterized protein FDP41_000031 [Naegleria fowleri]KAF0984992.1 hypothetical protein FDP41_000031 [Naegleria fowleri]CAG4714496.1 unnamed protein product [Naegleria fowleri]
MVESPILGQQQTTPTQQQQTIPTPPQEIKTVGGLANQPSRNDYVPESGDMGGSSGGGGMSGGGGYNPQLQTMESVDRQLTQAFGTPLNPSEQQPYIQQQQQQPLGSEMTTRSQNDYAPQMGTSSSLSGFTPQQQEQPTMTMSGESSTTTPPPMMIPPPPPSMISSSGGAEERMSSGAEERMSSGGGEMGRSSQKDDAPPPSMMMTSTGGISNNEPSSNLPMASSTMMMTTTPPTSTSIPPPPTTTVATSPQPQPPPPPPPSSTFITGSIPPLSPRGGGGGIGGGGGGERKLIVCSSQPSEELLETHLRGGRVTVPPGNYEGNIQHGAEEEEVSSSSLDQQQQQASSSSSSFMMGTTRAYASPSLLSTLPSSDLSHKQPHTQFRVATTEESSPRSRTGASTTTSTITSSTKPYSSIFEPPAMRAIITCDFNPEEPERAFMYLEKYPQPSPHRLNPGEVIVKMKYASMNAFDCKINQGKIPMEIASSSRTYWRQYPMVGGHDGAGMIYKFAEPFTIQTSSSSTTTTTAHHHHPTPHTVTPSLFGFRVGDPVLGFTSNAQFGTFGEYAIFNERDLVMKPENLSWEEAASLPYSALTAMECFLKADKKRQKKKAQGPSMMMGLRTGGTATTTTTTVSGSMDQQQPSMSGGAGAVGGGMGGGGDVFYQKEPIDSQTVQSLVNGDKFGSVFIHGGNTSVGIWCILLAKHYFGAQRIYTTICGGNVEDEELLKRLGADVVVNCSTATTGGTEGSVLSTHLNNYDELINKDLQQYWVEFLGELERQAGGGGGVTTTASKQIMTQPPSSVAPSTQETTTTSAQVTQPPTSTAGTGEGITTESTTAVSQPSQPMQEQTTTIPPQQQPQQQLIPPTTSTASGELSPRSSTSWPHKGFKSRKDMDKCKNLVGSLNLAIDTVGGHDVMTKCFGLLSGSHSHFVTLCPPVELEQRKLSGKDVWKMVSLTATNRIKSFFANYPHFHTIIHVESDRELLQEVVDWYSQVKNEPFMRNAIRHKIYDLRDGAACMLDLREKKFSSHKLLLDMSY